MAMAFIAIELIHDETAMAYATETATRIIPEIAMLSPFLLLRNLNFMVGAIIEFLIVYKIIYEACLRITHVYYSFPLFGLRTVSNVSARLDFIPLLFIQKCIFHYF